MAKSDNARNHGSAVDRVSFEKGVLNLDWAMKVMGYTSLRAGQDKIVYNAMALRDTLGFLPTGCHRAGTQILMHDGTNKRVENVVVGDCLMGPDSIRRVVHQLARGNQEMAAIIPVKGDSFVVNLDHVLTLVRTEETKSKKYPCDHRGGELVDVTVREWLTWKKWKKHIHKLIRVSVDFPEGEEPKIDPYLLGLYLGDGDGNGSIRITSHDAVTGDFLQKYCESNGFVCREIHGNGRVQGWRVGMPDDQVGRGHKHPIKEEFKRIGLYGCGSGEKFIPHEYKTASRETRLALLAGLIDTDGSLSCGCYDYVTKSSQLAQDVLFVARSLGLAAYSKPCVKKCQTGTEGLYHRVIISGDLSIVPVRLSRKRAHSRAGRKNVLRVGFKVQLLPKEDYYGFSLDVDGRYLLGDFTVTHNTGKSATFVIPTLCLELRTLIFSPLVALMQDQVQGLWKRSLKAGQLSSMQSDSANTSTLGQWLRGELQFLYVAPERLKNDDFMQMMVQRPPDMVVVDEAHSISQWADNFRPAYAKIGNFIANLHPKIVLALTATATEEVEEDIRHVLGIQDAAKIAYLPERTNLKLCSSDYPGDFGLAKKIENINGSVIVYCATVKGVESLGQTLSSLLPNQVSIFHGQLPPGDKRVSQEMFMQNQLKVMVATNAFGMGIDKPDIRAVFHYDVPGTIEALVQETGRAGRDGLDSHCETFFRDESYKTQRYFLDASFPSERDIRGVFNTLCKAHKNERGEVTMTIKDIAAANGNPWAVAMVNSSISILARHGVIERPRSDEKVGKVSFHTVPDDMRLREYYDLVCGNNGIGKMGDDGTFAFDVDLLSTRVGVNKETVTKNLRKWQGEGLLTYIPPFRGAPTKIIGDVEKVEFKRLKAKYEEAVLKLDRVIQYFKIPDVDKHTFLRNYFAHAAT
jgi:RecQ family ATP-dependent DNA helicase